MSESLLATEALGGRGATHPRVTLADIEAAIAREEYFVLSDAIERKSVGGLLPEDVFTICVLFMKDGFMQLGYSAPASLENFDAEKGRVFARENAIRGLWPIMGFALRDRLHATPPIG